MIHPDGRRSELSNLSNQSSVVEDVLSSDTLISAFVRRIAQDKNGCLWLGTNGDGVVRYNGEKLDYFSLEEGFAGQAVRAIVEDDQGNLWFGTNSGMTKYDPNVTTGNQFTNYSELHGIRDNDIWSMSFDHDGVLWIGTYRGVTKFDGQVFTQFELPETKTDPSRGVSSQWIVHSIMQDQSGRMWFGTNGGAYILDGENLFNISEENGLCHDVVNDILEDRNGNIWFATHHNGVCRLNENYDLQSAQYVFTHFGADDGVTGTETWSLFEDQSGGIWFPIENSGMYRYDPSTESFRNFTEKDGLTTNAIQCTFQDEEGRIWLGGWTGLYRYEPALPLRPDGKCIYPVTRYGPWD